MHVTLIIICWLVTAAASSQSRFISCTELCNTLCGGKSEFSRGLVGRINRWSDGLLRSSCNCSSKVESVSGSNSASLNNYGVYFEPADVYILHRLTFLSFFTLNPTLKLAPGSPKVAKNRNLFRKEQSQEVTLLNEYKNNNDNIKIKNKLVRNQPVYSDIDVQESKATEKTSLKKIKSFDQFHVIEERFQKCVYLHLLKYFKANNISAAYHQIKIKIFTDSQHINKVKTECHRSHNFMKLSLQEIMNLFPKTHDLSYSFLKPTRLDLPITTQNGTLLSSTIPMTSMSNKNHSGENHTIVNNILHRPNEKQTKNKFNLRVLNKNNSRKREPKETLYTTNSDGIHKITLDDNQNYNSNNLTLQFYSSMTNQKKDYGITQPYESLPDQNDNSNTALLKNVLATTSALGDKKNEIEHYNSSNIPSKKNASLRLKDENFIPDQTFRVNHGHKYRTPEISLKSNGINKNNTMIDDLTTEYLHTDLPEFQDDKTTNLKSLNLNIQNLSVLLHTSTSEYPEYKNTDKNFSAIIQFGKNNINNHVVTAELSKELNEQLQLNVDITDDPIPLTYSVLRGSNKNSDPDHIIYQDQVKSVNLNNGKDEIISYNKMSKSKTLYDTHSNDISLLQTEKFTINTSEKTPNSTLSINSTTAYHLNMSNPDFSADKKIATHHYGRTSFSLTTTVPYTYYTQNSHFGSEEHYVSTISPVSSTEQINKKSVSRNHVEQNKKDVLTDRPSIAAKIGVINPLIDNEFNVDINVEQDYSNDIGLQVHNMANKHFIYVAPTELKTYKGHDNISKPRKLLFKSNKYETTTIKSTINENKIMFTEKDIKIPKVITREFINDTVTSELHGTEILTNNDFKNSTFPTTMSLVNKPTQMSTESNIKGFSLKGRIYFLFNKTRVPAHFVQEDDGQLFIGIDGMTLCSKIDSGKNKSLLINLICNCVQHGYCTSSYSTFPIFN